MMARKLTFEEYLGVLSQVNKGTSPLEPTEQSIKLKKAADELATIASTDLNDIADWASGSAELAGALGLAVGLTQEQLKNVLKTQFNTQSVRKVASERPEELVDFLDEEYDLLALLREQIGRSYNFGDILVARSSGRRSASRAGAAGRSIEDQVEAIARGIGLQDVDTRTRFQGISGNEAPCDVLVRDQRGEPFAAIACKGFDSTGSKLSDAEREIRDMANVRLPRMSVYAVVDGIGWHSRQGDLRRIHGLWTTNAIDGLYTLKTLDALREDLEAVARRAGLI